MGQFSWLDCQTGDQILDDYKRTSYLLVPRDFGGGHIEEPCYDGYGNFGGNDVYDLVADWNKEMIPEIVRRIRKGSWVCTKEESDCEKLMAFYNDEPYSCDKRWLGILMACYDEDNASLEYPIKITYDPNAVYENCKPSPSDPDQGWGPAYDDDEYEEDWYGSEDDEDDMY